MRQSKLIELKLVMALGEIGDEEDEAKEVETKGNEAMVRCQWQ